MLIALRVSNFAILPSLEVRFGPGLNVITGETGAGKSILVDALHLALGGRADTEVVRTGADEAVVEALFEPADKAALAARLAELGLPAADGELLVRRTVAREGRSRAWVNGAMATLAQLAQAARGLVDICGQHEHVSLMDPSTHLSLLDAYAGLSDEVAAYRAVYDALAAAEEERQALARDEAERGARLDFLRFQLEEIDRLDPKPGEDEALEGERRVLASAERLARAAKEAENALYSGEAAAVDRAGAALTRVTEAAAIDPALGPIAQALQGALAELTEAARELSRYAGRVAGDPERLEEVTARLEALRRLCRKHGGSVESLLARRDAMQQEMARALGSGERLAELAALSERLEREARAMAAKLTARRRAAGEAFAREVSSHLGALGMARTVLEARILPLGEASGRRGSFAAGSGAAAGSPPDSRPGSGPASGPPSASRGASREASALAGLGPRGADAVELYMSPNPGEQPRPLSRIASGGELSRVLLAVKRALTDTDPVSTYVFDEVDSGIGGATADVVGRLLAEVSRGRQVLCITHLPQIAVHGRAHYRVSKTIQNGRTEARVEALQTSQERILEVARMLGGAEITAAACAHAAELWEQAAGQAAVVRLASAGGRGRRKGG